MAVSLHYIGAQEAFQAKAAFHSGFENVADALWAHTGGRVAGLAKAALFTVGAFFQAVKIGGKFVYRVLSDTEGHEKIQSEAFKRKRVEDFKEAKKNDPAKLKKCRDELKGALVVYQQIIQENDLITNEQLDDVEYQVVWEYECDYVRNQDTGRMVPYEISYITGVNKINDLQEIQKRRGEKKADMETGIDAINWEIKQIDNILAEKPTELEEKPTEMERDLQMLVFLCLRVFIAFKEVVLGSEKDSRTLSESLDDISSVLLGHDEHIRKERWGNPSNVVENESAEEAAIGAFMDPLNNFIVYQDGNAYSSMGPIESYEDPLYHSPYGDQAGSGDDIDPSFEVMSARANEAGSGED